MKNILCLIGLHDWKMLKEFMMWECERCGEKKEEYWG